MIKITVRVIGSHLKVTAQWSPAIKVSIIIKTKPAGGQWGNIYKYNNKSIITIVIIMSGQTGSSSTISPC